MSYTVSLPDLRGFARQVQGIGTFYLGMRDELKSTYIHDVVTSDAMGDTWEFDGSPLGGALAKFKDQFLELMVAEEGACERLGDGLTATAQLLNATADEYENKEHTAKEELESAGPSDENQEVVDAITGGEPNSDWSAELEISDFLGFDRLSWDYVEMGYQDEMVEAKDVLESVLDGAIIGTIDELVQYVFGFSPVREGIKPFLGDWGFLYFMQHVYTQAAKAANSAALCLEKGTNTLLNADWTGSAAESFAAYSQKFRKVLVEHENNMTDAARLLGDMADRLDKAGEMIADLAIEIADTIIGLYTRKEITKFYKFLRDLSEAVIGLVEPFAEGIMGTIELVGVTETSTADLCSAADDLEPPPRKN